MTSPSGHTGTGHGWHLDTESIAAYRDGRLGPVPAASLEAHVLRCAACRAALATASTSTMSTRRIDGWAAIADRIDRPSRRLVARRWWVQVTLGSPLLLRSALVLLMALVAVPSVLAFQSPQAAAAGFWSVAPIVPLAGATLAYRRDVDPAGALAPSTPMASLPLLLVRTVVVFAASIPIALMTAVLLPVPWELLIGWLLPGFAFPALVLAIGTRADPTPAAVMVVVAWSTGVVADVYRLRDLGIVEQLERSAVNAPAFQLSITALGLIAAALYWSGHDRLVGWSAT